MNFKVFASAIAAATLLGGSAASAADLLYAHASFEPFNFDSSKYAVITQFETGANPATLSNLIYDIPGYLTVTGGAGANLVTGSVANGHEAPAVDDSPVTRDTSQYLAIHKNAVATVTFAKPISEIAFYVGSFDWYDKLTFHYVPPTNPTTETGDGTWVDFETLGFVGVDGNPNALINNGWLTLKFDRGVSSIDLTAGYNSFEISKIAIPVPEPSTWAMMVLGFGGAGAMLRMRRRSLAIAA